jgi:autotransporter-associated beta strand protein
VVARTLRSLGRRKILLAAAIGAAGLFSQPALGQQWISTTDGTWSTGSNWNTGTPPVSSTTTDLTFSASGTTSYVATNNIGTGTFTLNRLTLNNTGTGTITLAGAVAGNTFTFAGTNPTIDTQAGTTLFLGLMAGSATITKTGPGTFIHDSNNGAFTGTIIINGGTFQNRATNVAATNFNAVSIVVNNTGTYRFGENGVGDPSVPNTTYITVNTGGTVLFEEGEQMGGVILDGGMFSIRVGGPDVRGAAPSEFRSGTLFAAVAGTPINFNGTHAFNKTTSGTVTVTDIPLNTTGGVNIQEGILSTNSGFNATGNLTFGTNGAGATAGTLEYRGPTGTLNKPVVLNDGGGTLSVLDAATVLTASGTSSGTGALTKAGAGTLVLTGTNAYTGGTTVSAGTLQVGAGGVLGSLAGNVSLASNTTLALSRSDNITFAGNVSGGGNLSHLGAGTSTLTGALTHGGTTTVSAGTLRINAQPLTGAVTIADTATLSAVSGASPATLTVPSLRPRRPAQPCSFA